MCGIFFSLTHGDYVVPDQNTEGLLKHRGPDSSGIHHITLPTPNEDVPPSPFKATFLSTVLSLRGASIVEQPLRDTATGSVLCWNGEAWTLGGHPIEGNDSEAIFKLLLESGTLRPEGPRELSIERVVKSISTIRGPFAFVFYDATNHFIYYGRDCLGRRSLLQKSSSSQDLILSSVCDNASGDNWDEVEADGLYVVDVLQSSSQKNIVTRHIPHLRIDADPSNTTSFCLPFPALNTSLDLEYNHADGQYVQKLGAGLRRSLELRVRHVRESFDDSLDAKVAILFSGGLDCTVLARLCHEILPPNETIDLLNVAFENPRVHKNLDSGVSPYELCPDRITARSSYVELQRTCPNRHWRLVEVDVPYSETVAHRATVMSLMHPHNTEMDLSISYALYFASRGVGASRLSPADPPQPHTTQAHVLLSGLGADELFGGYQRHAVAFARKSYPGLIDELALDFNRLGKRNLGRDDRVISDSGREVRFPFLDEDVISFALGLPVVAKCDFGRAQVESEDPMECLEPGKKILRLLAWSLGMKDVAAEKKRAIQFGARTAKMETGRTKGTHALT